MNEQYIFKIINRFSFLLVIFNYILFAGENILYTTLSFIWICLCTYSSLWLKLRNDKYKKYFLLALIPTLATLFFTNTRNDFAVLSILCVYAFHFSLQDSKKIFLESSKLELRNGLIAIAFILPISYICRDIPRFEAVSVPFLFLYLISGIMLSRATRSALHNKSTSKLNFTYAFIVSSLMFFLSIEKIRHYIVSFVLMCIKYFGIIVGYIANLVLLAFPDIVKKNKKAPCAPPDEGSFTDGKITKDYFTLEDSPIYLIAKIAFIVFLVILVIFIVKKLFGSYKKSKISQEEFIESHEFITSNSEGFLRKKVFSKIKNIFTPKTYTESIRYHYSKYIKSCVKSDIPITSSDTTSDINYKSQELYNKNLIDKMREIYISIRYGNIEATKDRFKTFMELYNSLKKTKNN